jgi:SAM-dependent methyltransferase
MAKDGADCQQDRPPSQGRTPMTAETAVSAKPYHAAQAPSDWVLRFLPHVRAGGTVLDVACGTGRHVAAARAAGLAVVGLDRDPTGLGAYASDPAVAVMIADLEAGGPWPPGARRFDAVVVTNYLFRPILPDIAGAVAPDGILIYETFARGQERHGRPRRAEFMLAPNELIVAALSAGLIVVAFEQGELAGRFCSGGAAKIVQRIAAVGPEHPLALAAPLPIGPVA